MKYIQDFLDLNVDELNEDEIEKLLFLSIGVLSEIILEQKYYSQNKELKSFTNDVLTQNYKDYLFDSRPTLYARIIKDLRKSKSNNLELFYKVEKSIQAFLAAGPGLGDSKPNNTKTKTNKNNNGKKTSSNPKIISDWRNVIESEK